jgi:ABC-type multidrug transport system fused ATPase/permease subunit
MKVYRRFAALLRPHRGRLLLVLAASAVGPFLVAARIWLLKVLIDDVLSRHHPQLLPAVATAFVVIAVLSAAIGSWKTGTSGWIGAHVVGELRVRCYGALQECSLRYFHGQRLGDLLTRLSVDIAAIEDLLITGLNAIISSSVMLVLFLVMLVVLNPGLVLVAAGIVPVLAITTVLDARLGRRVQHDVRERTSELTSAAEEGLSAIALVKAFARADHEQRRFAVASRRNAAARVRMVRLRAVFPPLAELTAGIGTAVVAWVGASQVLAGRLSAGSLVVFLSYLASLYTPIQGLSRVASGLQRAMVGAERVTAILDVPAELKDRGGALLPPVAGRVDFRHVTFAYGPGRPALRDVSFTISPGEVVALIGPSGAGKTTIVSLLLSYYDPGDGTVSLDRHPMRDFDAASCRRQVSAVLQEPMLFDASIRENIRYGRLDATDAEVEAAAAIAQADEFIRELPDGYETVAGPRGARMSGGQRQRLAIARAVIKAAPVLVLDEATSALDPGTEASVLQGLRSTCANAAVLLVAHRYSAVRFADRVVVLEGGRLVAQGSQAQLLASKDRFSWFMRSQTAVATLRCRRARAAPRSPGADRAGRSVYGRAPPTRDRSGNSAQSRLDQMVELLGHRIVPVGGEEHVQHSVGVGMEELVADGRVGTALQEQADHLELTVQDRPVQAGPPEVGRDVGVQAAVKEPAHDLGPAVLAGMDERLGHDLLRTGCRRDPGWDREEVGGVGARRRGVGPQPAVRIETGPDKIQPAAGGIGPERLRDDPVSGEQVHDLRVAKVDGVLQRGDAFRPGAGVGAGAEQQPYVLDPVGEGGRGKREVQAAGLADQHIDRGARHAELLAEPDTGDRLGVGEHLQQGVGLPGGQLGQPAGVAGQQGFGLRAQAPPLLPAFVQIAQGFLGERHELAPGREAELPGDDQPRVAMLGGGGAGGSGVPGNVGPQPPQRARVAAAQVGEQGIGQRGQAARHHPPQPGDRPVAGSALALDVRPELGPGTESVFLGEDELGVAEQEPPGGPVAKHVGHPGLSCSIARGVCALQVLGLLTVVLQVWMGRQLEMTIGHHNLLRRRGPLARPERGWWCPVH